MREKVIYGAKVGAAGGAVAGAMAGIYYSAAVVAVLSASIGLPIMLPLLAYECALAGAIGVIGGAMSLGAVGGLAGATSHGIVSAYDYARPVALGLYTNTIARAEALLDVLMDGHAPLSSLLLYPLFGALASSLLGVAATCYFIAVPAASSALMFYQGSLLISAVSGAFIGGLGGLAAAAFKTRSHLEDACNMGRDIATRASGAVDNTTRRIDDFFDNLTVRGTGLVDNTTRRIDEFCDNLTVQGNLAVNNVVQLTELAAIPGDVRRLCWGVSLSYAIQWIGLALCAVLAQAQPAWTSYITQGDGFGALGA